MGRPKAKKAAAKAATPEQETPEAETEGGGQEGHGIVAPPPPGFETHGRTEEQATVSKAEAVRAALKEGLEAVGDIADFIKVKFGIEIPRQMVSSYKAQQKARDAKQGDAPKGKRGRKPRVAVEGYVVPPPKKAGSAEGDLLAAMEAMKPLVASMGAEKVKRIVDLLG